MRVSTMNYCYIVAFHIIHNSNVLIWVIEYVIVEGNKIAIVHKLLCDSLVVFVLFLFRFLYLALRAKYIAMVDIV